MRSKNKRILKRMAILGTLVCLVVVLGFGLSVVRNRVKHRTLQESREQGLAAYEAGDLAEATEKLGYYHATRNDDPDVAYKLADATRKLPSDGTVGLRSAVAFAKRAADLAPSRIEPLELLLELHGLLNQQTERMAMAERLLRLDPENGVALDAKARALVALGRRDEALETVRQLTQLTPDDPEAHRLMFAIMATEDPTIGRTMMADYVKKLGEEHPDDARFIVLRIHATALMGDMATARQIAGTMVDSDLDARTLGEMMRSFDLLGMRDAGDALLARHAEKPEMLGVTSVLSVQRQFMRGQIESATETARRALETEGAATPDLLPWAMACAIEISDEKYEQVLAGSEFATSYHRAMRDGFRALAQQDALTARSSFNAALNIRRDDPLAGALLADSMERIGAWKDAGLQRRDVLRRTPEFTTVRLAHIESLLSRGRPAEADASVREGLELDPGNGALLLGHILAISELAATGMALPEEIRSALNVARALEGDSKDVTPVTIPLARLLIASGNLPELEQTLDRIVGADVNALDMRALMSLANAMSQTSMPRVGELYAMIDGASRIDPYIVLERATSMVDAGETERGMRLIESKLEQARLLSPGDALRMEMARAAFLDRTLAEGAKDALRALADAHPQDAAVQSLVLESQAAWSDMTLIADAVSRLRSITGDGSSGWRLHEARRLLVFEPTEQKAAAVVSLLGGDANSETVDPISQLVLADALSILGDMKASADAIERAVDAGIDNPSLVLRLISLRQSMGEIDSARRRAIALARYEPVSDQIRRERVGALVRLGIYEPARADAERLATSSDARDLVMAAVVAGKLGETAKTNQRLDALMGVDSIPDEVLTPATLTLVEADRTRDAYALIERFRQPAPTAAFVVAEATLLEATGRAQDAAALLNQASSNRPDPVIFAAKARVLSRLGQIEPAQAACDAGLALAPTDQELLLLKEAIGLVSAQHSASLGEDAQAARRVIEALRKYTVDTSNPPELMRQLRLITQEEPTFYPGWSVLTSQLQSQGRLQEAAETAQTAMRLMPGDPRPARLAVDALLMTDQPRLALAAADEWSRRSRPDSYQADTTMAALHVRLGSYLNAAQTLAPWKERISGDPDATPILVRLLAVVSITRGNEEEAWEQIRPRVERDDRWLSHAIEISRDLIQHNSPVNAAESWLDRVVALRAAGADDTLRIAQARLDIATATGSESDLLAVLETLDRLQAMSDQSDWHRRGALLLRITAERMLGRLDDALTKARELAAARPDDALALSLFAQLLVETDGDPQQALKAASRSLELAETGTPDRGRLASALDALGRSQLAAGLVAEADSTFRRLLGLQSGSAVARLGLAEVFVAMSKPEDARRMLADSAVTEAVKRSPSIQTRVEQIRNSLPR